MQRKQQASLSGDRHKPAKMLRIRAQLARQLVRLAERRATDPTEEANRAVRELLEREGLWPSEQSREQPSHE